MKSFPLTHTVLIVFLLGCIFLVLNYLPVMASKEDNSEDQAIEQPAPAGFVKAEAQFKFSKKPKLIRIQTDENEVLLELTSFEYEFDSNSEPFAIPIQSGGKSKLKLEVEWDEPPPQLGYYFCELVFKDHEFQKFGLNTTTEFITEDITLHGLSSFRRR